ncbi:MAG: TPM domain-containing protein [Anaerococcus sp.]|nr:TPM domain-containing protein [Anaerococcus sp.]
MKKLRPIKLGVLLLLLFIIHPSLVKGQSLDQKVDDFYYDQLSILDDKSKKNIRETNLELQEKIGSQVLVLTLDNPQGLEAMDYGTEIFNDLKIGDKEKDNGALILFLEDKNADRRQVAIITGYGIEGRLNDGKVGRIIDEFMMDYFADGNYSEGLNQGFNAVVGEIAGEYDIKLTGDYTPYQEELADDGIPWFVLVVIFIFLVSILSNKKTRGRRRRRGLSPTSLWTLYNLFDDDDNDPFSGGSFGGGSFGGGLSSGGFSGGGGSSGGGGASRSF